MNFRIGLSCIALLSASSLGKESPALDALSLELKASLRESASLPFAQRHQLAPKASHIRLQLSQLLKDDEVYDANVQKMTAVMESFVLSSECEWAEYLAAAEGLREWILLVRKYFDDKSEIARVVLYCGERHVSKWLSSNADECSQLLDSIGKNYAVVVGEPLRTQWFLWQSQFEFAFGAEHLLPADKLSARERAFLGSPTIPEVAKSAYLASMASELNKDNQPQVAEQKLAAFAQDHPEALTSLPFCLNWYYILMLGLGDRVKAKEVLQRYSRTVKAVQMQSKEAPLYQMFALYYGSLGVLDDEWRRLVRAERKLDPVLK